MGNKINIRIKKEDFKKKLGIDKILKEQEIGLNFLRDKVRELKDGKDGKTFTKEELETIIKPLIPPAIEAKEKTPEEIRDALETLEKNERLEIKAIKDLREELDTLKKLASQTRVVGGGTSQIGVAMALSNLIKSETPTGTITGTNKTFTTTTNISLVLSFHLNGMFIHDSEYTKSGNTITFVTAPPVELSGTSFTIKYIT